MISPISIPLSLVFIDMKPVYMSWSSAGLFSVNVLFIAYILSQNYFNNRVNSDYIYSTPITSLQNILANYLFVCLVGVLQIICSVLLINSINGHYFRFLDIVFIIVLTFPSIILMSTLGSIVGFLHNNKIMILLYNTLIFIVLSFGLGSFIPLSNIHQNYPYVAQYFPVGCSIVNIQKIISAESVYFSLFIVSIMYAIISFLFLLYLIDYKVKNRNI